MRRENVLQNFEKMELVLIGDYHYFNLLFCKEELMLSNRKTAILLNIYWQILMNNNPGYERPKEQIGPDGNPIEDQNLLKSKTFEDDVNLFKTLLFSHSTGKTEEELKAQGATSDVPQMLVFEPSQLKQIIEYGYQAYIDKFSLYKYVFENKKKNEEVKLVVTISEPLKVPPLREALYMGFDLQPIIPTMEEEDEEMSPEGAADQSNMAHSKVLGNSTEFGESALTVGDKRVHQDDNRDSQLVKPGESRDPRQSDLQRSAEEIAQDEDLKLIDARFHAAQDNFDKEIHKSDVLIDDKIASKGKKKK